MQQHFIGLETVATFEAPGAWFREQVRQPLGAGRQPEVSAPQQLRSERELQFIHNILRQQRSTKLSSAEQKDALEPRFGKGVKSLPPGQTERQPLVEP